MKGSQDERIQIEMAYYSSATTKASLFFFLILSFLSVNLSSTISNVPVPTPWPLQFHSVELVNTSGILQIIELWYDWPNGRNFNIIRDQLGYVHYDLLWNNGTTFYYTPESNNCSIIQFDVGIPRPDWFDGATYLGQRHVDGFLCNAWEKLDFLWYYEDVVTKRPVHWVFFTGMEAHLMTFEVGAVLEDEKWQAPPYCFDGKPTTTTTGVPNYGILKHSLPLMDGVLRASLFPII